VDVNPLQILHADADVLVINKPAGLVCHPSKAGENSSLIGRLRRYLQHEHRLKPETRPHLINRLDRETSGIVIAALNRHTAGELGRLWESRAVQKEYLAIVHGTVPEAHGIIDAPLGKDDHSRVAIKDCVRPDGAPARTEYWVEQCFKSTSSTTPGCTAFTLLRIVPHTGRKHQIRIHLAHLGYPIVGDKLYGGDEDLYLALVQNRLTEEQRGRLILPHHALHASQVRFNWRDREHLFRAEPEDWFSAFVCR
jgi:23S rRNA pseudouridine1911/1915/1917 synthase